MAKGWKNFRGDELINKTIDGLSEALVDIAEAVGAEADQEVPHDEGWLQNSKFIDSNPNNPLEVYIGYGGGGVSGFPVVPYAVKWHELVDKEGNTYNPDFQKGRKSKYLSDPLKRGATTANDHISKKMRKIWK